jgi:uncharacterized protein (TIGR00251 family)
LIKFTVKDAGITFTVRVQPRASQSALAGEMDGMLKVRLAAPPVDGAANEELIRFLAKLFGVPRHNIAILSGLAAKNKILRITGLMAEDFLNAVQP